jgi:hypothetical protein
LSPRRRIRARADEGDADPLAQLGERGVLGDEAPADPGGVRAGGDQRVLQRGQVEVRPRGRRPDEVGDVGLPHEGGPPVDVGVQRDRFDRRTGLRGQVTHGVDQPACGLTSIDDRDTSKHAPEPL